MSADKFFIQEIFDIPDDKPPKQGDSVDASLRDMQWKILIEKMKMHKSEIILQANRWHNSARYSQIITFATVGGIYAVMKDNPDIISVGNWWIWALVPVMLNLVICYLVGGLADAVFILLLSAVRMGQLEREINELAGKKLLLWESVIITHFFRHSPMINKILNPATHHSISALFIFAIGAVVIPIGLNYLIFERAFNSNIHHNNYIVILCTSIFIAANFLYSLFSTVNVLLFGRRSMERSMERIVNNLKPS